jgi:hypothetical protein
VPPIVCLGDVAFQHLAFVIDSPPKVVFLAVDLRENLVEVPLPAAGFHAVDAAFLDLGCKHRAEAMPPEPDGFVADIHATLMQNILDIAQREREPHVQHHS